MSTVTNLKVFDGEVVASVQYGNYLYIGTNKGEIIRYTISSGVATTLVNVNGKVTSMLVYSGLLYVGVAGGKLVSVTP